MGPLGTNLSETLIDIYMYIFHPRKRIWKFRLENGGHVIAASMCWYVLPSMTIGAVLTNLTIQQSCYILFATRLIHDDIRGIFHDDVIKWKHFPRYWPFVRGIHRWPVDSPHKGQWRGALMFSLMCVRTNGWINSWYAGDLRRHMAHCDVTVMLKVNSFGFEGTAIAYCSMSCWLWKNSIMILM